MIICAAQTRPVTGDIPGNIRNHLKFIELAVSNAVDVIIFPELSLTGYEPALAKVLAAEENDCRINIFQDLSNSRQITIGIGLPTKNDEGICISMLIFQPNLARITYSKKHLHADEKTTFIAGNISSNHMFGGKKIALAICYEISVPNHMEEVDNGKSDFYFASVAKFVNGIDKATERLSDIAEQHSMIVLMANSIGPSDGHECAGRSSIWNKDGILRGQLNDRDEGLLIYDSETGKTWQKTWKAPKNLDLT